MIHMCGAGLRRCSGVRTQTPAMGHRLLRAGRLPVPPSIVVVHRRMTVRVDSAGILHVLGGQPFTWGPSSEWRRPDLNRRSLGYEPSGLPSFPTPRKHVHPREVHMLAGDVLPVWGVVICRSLEAGPCRSALCRVASVGTVCPTYLPRALFSCGPEAQRSHRSDNMLAHFLGACPA